MMLVLLLLSGLLALSCQQEKEQEQQKVLVLGGQGLAGSSTLKALLDNGYLVSALNSNKNYYDYLEEFNERVENVACFRSAGLDGCYELQQFLKQNKEVSAVVDFTSSSEELMSEAVRILGALSPELYVFVSAAAVYDVTENGEQPLQEEAGIRPVNSATRQVYKDHNEFGDKMLSAEEVLKKSGLPYTILRCADLVGPRDTTYRWWQYQLWAEYFSVINTWFPVPKNLEHTPFSLTYGDDVGQVIVAAIKNRAVASKQVYNVALDKTFTLSHLLLEICGGLNMTEICYADYTKEEDTSYYLYPSNHQGSLSIAKVQKDLGFVPTAWEVALNNTVEFYKSALVKFVDERGIVLKRLNKNIVPYLRLEPLSNAINSDVKSRSSLGSKEEL